MPDPIETDSGCGCIFASASRQAVDTADAWAGEDKSRIIDSDRMALLEAINEGRAQSPGEPRLGYCRHHLTNVGNVLGLGCEHISQQELEKRLWQMGVAFANPDPDFEFFKEFSSHSEYRLWFRKEARDPGHADRLGAMNFVRELPAGGHTTSKAERKLFLHALGITNLSLL